MFENGAVYKTPDGKLVVLLFLHGDVFCLLEIANGKLSIMQAEKWEYSRSELPRRLEDFEYQENGKASIEAHAPIFKEAEKPAATTRKKK